MKKGRYDMLLKYRKSLEEKAKRDFLDAAHKEREIIEKLEKISKEDKEVFLGQKFRFYYFSYKNALSQEQRELKKMLQEKRSLREIKSKSLETKIQERKIIEKIREKEYKYRFFK